MPVQEYSLGISPDRLRQAVERSGYSAAEVARRCGVTTQAMQSWLTGMKSPTASNLGALALITGCSVGYFYGEDDLPESVLRDAQIGRKVRELMENTSRGVRRSLTAHARSVAV